MSEALDPEEELGFLESHDKPSKFPESSSSEELECSSDSSSISSLDQEREEDKGEGSPTTTHQTKPPPRLPTWRIFTPNMVLILLTYMVIEAHITILNVVWANMMSEPVAAHNNADDTSTRSHLPFRFSGGAGMAAQDLAWSTAIYGALSFPIQMIVYPRLQRHFGTVRMWRLFQLGFPLLYILAPYLVVMPSTTPPPAGKSGPFVWMHIALIQLLVVVSGNFVIPAQLVLSNG